jgi:uncharacterized 2Fe-2S/4Fe-4S cluster protein (DUF4445 family)
MSVRIRLEPLGIDIDVEPGAPLAAALAPYGVEFPCGGTGDCGGCRVRVLDGPDTGWQLACRMRADFPVTLEVDQWTTPVLADAQETGPGTLEGTGVAVDIGTTTLAAQLIDRRTGTVLGVQTALNPQVAHGSDVMSRIEFAMHDTSLTTCIREAVNELTRALGGSPSDRVLVGNTAMHHLYCGLDVSPLARVPFRSAQLSEVHGGTWRFLRCLGGFVGSDILAGVVATGIHREESLCALIDLGTNGEIVVGNRKRLVCASTAAGPAFEAGRIKAGMRAATGAISHVSPQWECSTVGNAPARGICGSGLVDAVAVALDCGLISPNGRLRAGSIELAESICLVQSDIRELQLAKGAIASGLRILLGRLGATVQDLHTIYLAGAFGNYVDPHTAMRIGLLPAVAPEVIKPSGNTALRGARRLLVDPQADRDITVEHVELAADPAFQDEFASALTFPPRSSL